MSHSLPSEAIASLRELLGNDRVLVEAGDVAPYARNTFGAERILRGAVRASTVEEVREVVRIANDFGIALYPISGGKNWGYGASVPVKDGALVLDLGGMNRILEYSAEMGYLTLEPGVTFQQAAAFLEQQGARHMLNVTGAPPVTTVVGNTLERGLGSGPYGDRAQFVCGLEVVLANGACLQTGFGRFRNAKAANLFRAGVGPMLDGLFTQSNLGIVTKMTIWLFPKQPHFDLVQFAVRDEEGIAALADALRGLRFERTVDAAVSIWNDYRAASMHSQFPFEARGTAANAHRWYGAFATYSPTSDLARARARRIADCLGPHVDALAFHEFEEGRHARTRMVKGEETRIGAFGRPEIAAQLWQGTPKWSSARSCYWKKKQPIPERDEDIDILRGECGVLWIAPVVPFEGTQIRSVVALCEEICFAAGFEPFFSMISQHERTAYLVTMLIYDKADLEEDARAVACSRELLKRLAAEGYYPYRLGIQSMADLPPPDDDYLVALDLLKDALDPKRILAPGRYDFS